MVKWSTLQIVCYNTSRFTATETVNTIMNARSAAIMNWSRPPGSQAQRMLWMSKCLLLFVPPCWIVLSVPSRSLYYVPFRVFHYNWTGTTYSLPSTSIVVLMPQHRCHNLSSSSWGACPSAVWLLTLFFFGRLNHSCSWSVYIMSWIVPLFYTILSCGGSKHQC